MDAWRELEWGRIGPRSELECTRLDTAAERDLEALLVLLKDYRQATNAGGGRYIFHVSSNSMSAQPNLGRLNTF